MGEGKGETIKETFVLFDHLIVCDYAGNKNNIEVAKLEKEKNFGEVSKLLIMKSKKERIKDQGKSKFGAAQVKEIWEELCVDANSIEKDEGHDIKCMKKDKGNGDKVD
jgi:hypothetical protein